jgi:hypothetical protein
MLKNFRTHSLAVEFYKECKKANLPAYAKDQLSRADHLGACLYKLVNQ